MFRVTRNLSIRKQALFEMPFFSQQTQKLQDYPRHWIQSLELMILNAADDFHKCLYS
jgi:hypothetical protein